MSRLFDRVVPAEIRWQDGLPHSPQFNDRYGAYDKGISETIHTFIEANDLPSRWQGLQSQFVIAEIGFGCGLNFLVAWHMWRKFAPNHACLHYISCEKNPLKRDDLARFIALWPSLSYEGAALLDSYPVLTPGIHHLRFDTEQLSLTLILGDACEMYGQLLACGDVALEAQLRAWSVDAWFLNCIQNLGNDYDSLFQTMALLSNLNTTLTSYSAADDVKESLNQYGFHVQKLEGDSQNRYMIKAIFNKVLSSIRHRDTPWFMSKPQIPVQKKVIVVGAGLAGAFCAREFADRGYQVVVIDKAAYPAEGASGNPQAVLFPNISTFRSPLTELMLSGFLYATKRYQGILNEGVSGALEGLLQLLYNSKEALSAKGMQAWLSHYPELAALLDKDQASVVAGVKIEVGALHVPLAGWLDSVALCCHLLAHSNIQFVANTAIDALFYQDGVWVLDNYEAPIVVITSGWASTQFNQLKDLPLNAIAGQMTAVTQSIQSCKLRVPICASSHVLPASNAMHYLGASYRLDDTMGLCHALDDADNIAQLKDLAIENIFTQKVVKQWSGVRGATPNYLPMVGQVPILSDFNKRFNILKKNAKHWVASEGAYYPGLYVCAGFGSRGLTTVPLCAEWLVSYINGEPSILPRHLIKAIAPARFFIRDLVRSKL